MPATAGGVFHKYIRRLNVSVFLDTVIWPAPRTAERHYPNGLPCVLHWSHSQEEIVFCRKFLHHDLTDMRPEPVRSTEVELREDLERHPLKDLEHA